MARHTIPNIEYRSLANAAHFNRFTELHSALDTIQHVNFVQSSSSCLQLPLVTEYSK